MPKILEYQSREFSDGRTHRETGITQFAMLYEDKKNGNDSEGEENISKGFKERDDEIYTYMLHR